MPLEILSLGAGVQSTTVALMSATGVLPRLDHAIFADTGAEPAPVYAHLRWLSAVLEASGIAVHRVSTGNLMADALDPTHRFASMPLFVRLAKPRRDHRGRLVTVGMVRRQCTGEYKLKPLVARQMELAGVRPRSRPQGTLVRCWIGISWDESERMRDPLRSWITNFFPLIDGRITRADCLRWLAHHGYPKPPRSACKVCLMWNLASSLRWPDADDQLGRVKCPHRLACARCPFYLPKDSTRGQLLAVKDGIGQMLEKLTLTDDERGALEGDRDAVIALIDRLTDVPTPAGPTPHELGVDRAFIPISSLVERR